MNGFLRKQKYLIKIRKTELKTTVSKEKNETDTET